MPKLKEHLLPRINDSLRDKRASTHNGTSSTSLEDREATPHAIDPNRIFFKSDRMYQHHLLRVNYTTYDVRRSQDLINPATLRRDIMMLASDRDAENDHPFWFARVLGIYHVNVVYAEPGMLDYTSQRFDFLWVRWFQSHGKTSASWQEYRLDTVSFPPVAHQDSFGFVDPKDVLRGCHIIPRFRHGKVHSDGVSLSRCANDARDWTRYAINRYG
jgi:hypothetical protein